MQSVRTSKAVTGLPVQLSNLAAAKGLARPFGLRQLLSLDGSRVRLRRICVLRYDWQTVAPDAIGMPKWPDDFFEQLFNAPNGWSSSTYWNRCSFGLVELHFEFEPWRMLPADQAKVTQRDAVLQACKDQAAKDGVDLASFDSVIAFVNPRPNGAGATSGGAVFDQGGGIEFFEHELGHVLGFSHAFGTSGDYAYEDDWCVMGFTGPQSHPVPTPSQYEGIAVTDGFWFSGRRAATASLFRYGKDWEFDKTASVVRVDAKPSVTPVDLVAASHARLLDPVIAVINSENFQLCVEYRTNTADDAGIRQGEKVRSALVVHSIGRRSPLRWQGEQDPIWLEAVIPLEDNADAWVGHAWNDDPKDIHIQYLYAQGSKATFWITRASRP